MSLGRFATYFCLLMIACLVVFPQSFGKMPPVAESPVIQDLPPGCTVNADDDSMTCTPLPPDPMRRRPGATDALVPPRPRQLEAGGPLFLKPAFLDDGLHFGPWPES